MNHFFTVRNSRTWILAFSLVQHPTSYATGNVKTPCEAVTLHLENSLDPTKESLARLLVSAESAKSPGMQAKLLLEYKTSLEKFASAEADAKNSALTESSMETLRKEIASIARDLQDGNASHKDESDKVLWKIKESEKKLTRSQKFMGYLEREINVIIADPVRPGFMVMSGAAIERFNPGTDGTFSRELLRAHNNISPNDGNYILSSAVDPQGSRLFVNGDPGGQYRLEPIGSIRAEVFYPRRLRSRHVFFDSKNRQVLLIGQDGKIASTSPGKTEIAQTLEKSIHIKGDVLVAAHDDTHRHLFLLGAEGNPVLVRFKIDSLLNPQPGNSSENFISLFENHKSAKVTTIAVDSLGEQVFIGDDKGVLSRAPSTSQFSVDSTALLLPDNSLAKGISSLQFDSKNQRLFVGGGAGELLVVEFSPDGKTHLRSTVINSDSYWDGTPITAIHVDPVTQDLVVGGKDGKLEAFSRLGINDLIREGKSIKP